MVTRMNWKQLLSTVRVSNIGVCKTNQTKVSQYNDPRSQFERDIDQIIFSYPFRRLQDKTQVIPFPEFDFVHTRLTHSLEVASVGRSFGKMIATIIFNEAGDELSDLSHSDIGALIAAACLAHDIGNPPFGHSGEDSISYYFKKSGQIAPEWFFTNEKHIGEDSFIYRIQHRSIETKEISLKKFSKLEKAWQDFAKYEGNANGFRILTQNCEKGINPTAALLGTFTKYPRESFLLAEAKETVKLSGKSTTKHGFFQSERELFVQIASELGLIPISGLEEDDIAYHRHPLAFLMEASDDIAYGIIDFEDGCKLNLIDFDKVYDTLSIKDRKKNIYNSYTIGKSPKEIMISIAQRDEAFDQSRVTAAKDFKEAISYLRAKVINVLIHECFKVFQDNYGAIMEGKYDKALIEEIDTSIQAELKLMKLLIRKYVYNYTPVLQSEASGFEVMYALIDSLAISSGICYSCGDEEDAKQAKLSALLPQEYLLSEQQDGTITDGDRYERMMKILDYISGMTDNYAISIYRKIRGISLNNR